MASPGTAKSGASWLVFGVLTAGVGCYSLLQSLVVPVLVTIQQNLHTSQVNVTWVLTSFLLAASIFTPIVGRFGDIHGKKRTFVAVLLALSAGSIVSALAHDLPTMLLGRVIQAACGGVLPLGFGIIRDQFPAERIAGAVGGLSSVLGVATGLGIVLAGPIVRTLDVHWLFWLPAIISAVAAMAVHLLVPESQSRAPGRVSLLPAALLSGWLLCVLLGLSEAPTWGWASAAVIGLLAGGVVLATAWVVSEQRAVAPLIDLRMMRLPSVWTTNTVALLIGIGMYATFGFLPEFFQTPRSAGYGFGASITESGLLMAPSAAATFTAGLLSGPLVRRLGGKQSTLLGCMIATGAMCLLTFAHDAKWELLVVTGTSGLGFGLVFSAMANLIVDAVPPSQTGVASGMNANIRTIGGSIGAAMMATVVTSSAHARGLPRESGYTAGFLMLAITTALAAVAALRIPSLRHAGRPDEPKHPQLALVPGGTLVGDKPE